MTRSRTAAAFATVALGTVIGISALVGVGATPSLTTRVTALESQVAVLNSKVLGSALPTATPRPSVTAVPTPTLPPTPVPTPVPTPTIPPTPGPGGVTCTTYRIPGTIDHTGTTDVRVALGDWLATVPDGADLTHHSCVIPFDNASIYRISSYDSGINKGFGLINRRHLTLNGGGAWATFPTITPNAAGVASYAAFNSTTAWQKGATVLQRSPTGSGVTKGIFHVKSSTDIRVTGWTLDGGNPNTGTTSQFDGAYEWSSAMVIQQGSNGVSFDNNRVDNWRGFSWISDTDGSTVWPTNLKVFRNFIRGAEMGIGFIATTNAEVYQNIIKDTSYHAFDVEPYDAGDLNADINIHHNVVDAYGWFQPQSTWFFQIVNPGGRQVTTERITVEDNLIIKGPGSADNGNYDGQGGFSVRSNDPAAPVTDLVIRRNWSEDDQQMLAGGGRYSVRIDYCRNLTVTNNRQVIGAGKAPLIDPTTTHNTGTIVTSPNP